MRNLGLLILYHTNFSGNFNFLSNNLRYLSWHGYPFTGATNLQYLDSTSLFTIHESIGALAKLKFLSFRNCINLVEIPNSVKSITSLVTLDFYGCLKLTTLPLQWTYSSHMRSLIFLDLNFCNLHEVPDGIAKIKTLERLNLQGNKFDSLPNGFYNLESLSYINLSHCHELQTIGLLPSKSAYSGGRYFKIAAGSRDHRSGLYIFDCPKIMKKPENKSIEIDIHGYGDYLRCVRCLPSPNSLAFIY